MNKTDLIEQPFLRTDLPEFRPGDTVKVHVRVVEGNRERVQVFQGVVIRRSGGGIALPDDTACRWTCIWRHIFGRERS